MKTKALWALAAVGTMSIAGIKANAQEVVVAEDIVSVTTTEAQPCKTQYYSNRGDNWFIQLGAGVTSPFMENQMPDGSQKHHLTTVYNVGFGKWFSPYIGWRMSFLGGSLHWDNQQHNTAKWVNANVDFMWDMFNSLGGVNSERVFSIVPFVGFGGAFMWDFNDGASTIARDNGKMKGNSWALPLSAGLQLRLRLCKYVDFFAEGRAQFAGDNWNNEAVGAPVDMNLSVIGGFSFNIGGAGFKAYNPCDYTNYIANLNNQVNDLHAALNAANVALATAEAQLPCPEVQVKETVVEAVAPAPLMATVRFKINSAVISNEEMVNVYNVAQWMKENPEQNVTISGYADKDTGTSTYNQTLSKRRAEAVKDMLVNKYGVNPDRLSIDALGSSVQPYDTNNWNRIVIFTNN
ncbi:MAG: OmpA family protein [Muribaculaceae bacterium]|nr:OmpA family protein [Muribaculaceae bacterium]